MRFETSHSGEFLVTHRTGRIFPIVGAFMKCQVEFNIKCLGALVTSMWLFGEKSQEATEIQSFHNKCHAIFTSTIIYRQSKELLKSLLDLKSINPKWTRQISLRNFSKDYKECRKYL